MEKIAVTGSTGFIGKHLVRGLLKAGYIVYPIGRDFRPIDCDRVYHLACPSTTKVIQSDPLYVADTILDATRSAMKICPTAKFIYASSMGVLEIDNSAQGAYNVAKRCMEVYLHNSNLNWINYRLPAVYGEDMDDDFFIKKCVDGKAYRPTTPDKEYWIAHVDEVVNAMINLRPIDIEAITLGQIYELFNSGRRGLHRSATYQSSV